MADDQSNERNAFSGRAHDDGCPAFNADQWRHVGRIVSDAERVANEFGLDLVFHPHVATYVETPEEVEKFFDATSHTNIGLCLDTGHCVYGLGDSVKEAEKYKSKLRFVHIKDCNEKVLEEARRKSGPSKRPSNIKCSRSSARETSNSPLFPHTGKEWIFGLVRRGTRRQIRRHQHPTRQKSVAASLKYLARIVADSRSRCFLGS